MLSATLCPAHHPGAQTGQRGAKVGILDISQHRLQLPAFVGGQSTSLRTPPVDLGNRLLKNLNAVDRREAENAVDPLNELIKGMGKKQSARAFAGDRQRARHEAIVRPDPPRPFDPVGTRAIGELLTDDIIPHAKQRGVDTGTLGQNRIEHTVGDFTDLPDAIWTCHRQSNPLLSLAGWITRHGLLPRYGNSLQGFVNSRKLYSPVFMEPSADPVSQLLLDWYDRHHRDLPWRVSPVDRKAGILPDPYRVWLSEIMLQQTTVQAVKPYYAAFLRQWPRIEALASADEEDVLKAWAGLGYYSRARNLKKCADTLVRDHAGRFPADEVSLRDLPGIGDYTAAAIAAIAFDSHAAVVDGNVERVLTRLLWIDTPLPAAKTHIRTIMAQITPNDRPGDFAQAVMDLGAMLCTPKRPACSFCPVNAHCRVLSRDDPQHYPVKPPKKQKPVRRGAAFVAVAADGAVFLRRRGPKGMLAGMSEVPTSDWTARQDGALGVTAAPFRGRLGKLRHDPPCLHPFRVAA